MDHTDLYSTSIFNIPVNTVGEIFPQIFLCGKGYQASSYQVYRRKIWACAIDVGVYISSAKYLFGDIQQFVF